MVEITLVVYCEKCNMKLDASYKDEIIYVAPCDLCLEEKSSESYDEGYTDGYNHAKDEE